MKILLVCVACCVALFSAAPALANSPTQGAYQGPGSDQLSQVKGSGTSAATGASAGNGASTGAGTASSSPTTASASTLPFTGFSIPAVALIAIVMIGGGFALRFKGSSAQR